MPWMTVFPVTGPRKGILMHEMSHAIISRFFPVPAPVKVQEVLAMYVEYNLQSY